MKIKGNQKLKSESFEGKRVFVQFENVQGQKTGKEIDIPLDSSLNTLNLTLQKLTDKKDENFSLFFKNYQIQNNLKELLIEFNHKQILNEKTLTLSYIEESTLDIKPITRISTSLEGHTEAVLEVNFSPDGNFLASVSGDKTLRLWDVQTETPYICLEGHQDWSMIVTWSPDSEKIITSDRLGNIYSWEISKIKANKKQLDKETRENRKLVKKNEKPINYKKKILYTHKMQGHKNFVTALSWRPYHLDDKCHLFVSSSKDCTVRFWNSFQGKCISQGMRHKKSVTKVVWGGEDFVYSISQDLTLVIWDNQGKFIQQLSGHAHWINCLALNTFYPIQCGYLDFNNTIKDKENITKQQIAKKLYQKTFEILNKEVLVTGSDDNTIIIWYPREEKKLKERLTGHVGPINHIQFAPNSVFFVSASFDKTLRIWSVHNSTCLGVLRGHVSEVYILAFSRDSKWIISGSKDSTLQVWSMKQKKRAFQLPGHADQIYSVSWSFDGVKMASGGKDKMVRIWKN